MQISHYTIEAIVHEAAARAAAAFLFPMTFSSSYLAPRGNPEGEPILLVNGYMSFGATWHALRQRLVEAGFGPIYIINVGTGQTIEHYAEQVAKKVDQIQKETGRKDLILIGHSKGGLVNAYFATHQTEAEITHFITIGSPLEGTPRANIGVGHDAKQMRPDHPFHKELLEKLSASGLHCLHVASPQDGVVPLASATPGDPANHRIFPGEGHLSLIFARETANAICNWIKG